MCMFFFNPMPVTIHTEITIDASPESVSAILFDFNNYHKWNSWISISGPPPLSHKSTYYLSLVGEQLTMDQGELHYAPVIMLASPSVLKWTWYEKHKWFMSHEHYFEIVRSQNDSQKCILRHGERFSGAGARAMCYTKYYQKIQADFEGFNKELRILAESRDMVEMISKS
ncbi:hypothetical protein B0I72DRAFT_138106 [Yarrowia lipolytica]|uniref:SRPBCC domain-containing protein n=1 Tax=Yarrowia lipolytica TaxID=4952 RepID=A0A371C7U6_YARLL|nr:hypothetical protein B0I71DRAFT_131021 [Yarrowia lipolytica]RDW32420.1 hypothetical protein B0I72DRAFT_138106 [Yarrowia lipolytica]RDW39509.1 hypothetical protein B0I73DRAFT_131916 [Yarrowia lipolytica]RDW47228.1 hypothetical protein B0I74DRAFT_135720 [Yarrowia lipolytica]RDW53321.1 hypothetical protein B0I75DRAFT_136601 [Yarrowia lipolytica]